MKETDKTNSYSAAYANSINSDNEPFDPDKTMVNSRVRRERGELQVGDVVLNRYELLEKLGSGAMGIVFRCVDKTAGIEIALKALHPELSNNTVEMEDIKDNFQIVHNLHHPNIANYNTLEQDPVGGNYYLIMECVAGEDLRRWIRRMRKENALSMETVIPVIRQVAAALDYAHEQKIIHRDIKPGNIMIDTEGRVKVLDFGLAAQIQTSMTRVSMALQGTSGTAPYMAPEQWKGWAQGAAADQYALAVMTYEMLAGHLPFESTDVAVLQQAVLTQEPERIENVPKHIQRALERGMSKNPEERFNSCSVFVASLDGVKVPDVRKSRKKLWIALAASIAVLFLVGSGVLRQTLGKRINAMGAITSQQENQEEDTFSEDAFAELIAKNKELGFQFSEGGRTLLRAPSDITTYDIPNGVAIIGTGAFSQCSRLEKISIPSSVNTIEGSAFRSCGSLKRIVIPNSVKRIEDNTFKSCEALNSIVIPQGVDSIGSGVFSDCKSLRTIAIPDGVKDIDNKAFSGCKSLRSITIPDSVTRIGEFCFENCVSLSQVTLPSKIRIINLGCFRKCESLRSITIPDSVTSIGAGAFFYCISLKDVVIPHGVTSIGERAFADCKSLQSLKLPDTIKFINSTAFDSSPCEQTAKRDFELIKNKNK